MPHPLTDVERRVLDYLVEYVRSNTYQPSVREIGRAFDIKSTKSVSELLQSLAEKGWIERDPTRSRGVRIVGLDLRADAVSIPFYDDVDAATPSSHVHLDRRIVASAAAFITGMRGEHLAEEGVHSGDLLVIEPIDPSALADGDLVLTSTGGQTIVRRCVRRDGDTVLDPTAPSEVAVVLTPREAAAVVRGRVCAIVRMLPSHRLDASVTVAALAH